MIEALPKKYAFLAKEPGPRMLLEALALHGTKELAGKGNNPTIIAWAKEVGLSKTYSADSIPWCGLFMAVVAKRAGWSLPDAPLWALDWNDWEAKAERASLGDVVTFKRDGGGHVALYVGEDATAYHVLGGNQSDKVCITRILKDRAQQVRRPKWKLSEPANRRPILMAAGGPISRNEA